MPDPDSTKQEIEEELTHQRKIIVVLRRRRRALELQMYQQGAHALPQIVTEIEDLREQIREREQEIAQLETRAVEEKFPLAEMEYRVLLAETWSTPQGCPTVLGREQLELARLRLGVSLERAGELEQEIRRDLATEVFSELEPQFLSVGFIILRSRDNHQLKSLIRAIRLDPSLIASLSVESEYKKWALNKKRFEEFLKFISPNSWPKRDRVSLNVFITEIEQMMQTHAEQVTQPQESSSAGTDDSC